MGMYKSKMYGEITRPFLKIFTPLLIIKSCLTFLNQDSTKGALQVQRKDGNWIDADPIQGTLVVNIGDMLNVIIIIIIIIIIIKEII